MIYNLLRRNDIIDHSPTFQEAILYKVMVWCYIIDNITLLLDLKPYVPLLWHFTEKVYENEMCVSYILRSYFVNHYIWWHLIRVLCPLHCVLLWLVFFIAFLSYFFSLFTFHLIDIPKPRALCRYTTVCLKCDLLRIFVICHVTLWGIN